MKIPKALLEDTIWIFRPESGRGDNIMFLNPQIVITVTGDLEPARVAVIEVFDLVKKVSYLISYDTIDEAYEGSARPLIERNDEFDSDSGSEYRGISLQQKKELTTLVEAAAWGKVFPKTFFPLWNRAVGVIKTLDLFSPGE